MITFNAYLDICIYKSSGNLIYSTPVRLSMAFEPFKGDVAVVYQGRYFFKLTLRIF